MKKLFFALTASTFLFAGAAMAQEQPADPATEDPTMEAPATEDPAMTTEDPAVSEDAAMDQEQPSDDATASAESQEIQFDQLPDAVKQAFEGSDYAMWQVQTVTEMAPAEGTEAANYEISVTDGTSEETVTFSADGEQQ